MEPSPLPPTLSTQKEDHKKTINTKCPAPVGAGTPPRPARDAGKQENTPSGSQPSQDHTHGTSGQGHQSRDQNCMNKKMPGVLVETNNTLMELTTDRRSQKDSKGRQTAVQTARNGHRRKDCR